MYNFLGSHLLSETSNFVRFEADVPNGWVYFVFFIVFLMCFLSSFFGIFD